MSHPDPERLWAQRLPWWLAAAAVLAWLAAFAPDLHHSAEAGTVPPARYSSSGSDWPAPAPSATTAEPAALGDESAAAIAAYEGYTRNTP